MKSVNCALLPWPFLFTSCLSHRLTQPSPLSPQVMSTLIRADKTLTPQMAQNLDSNLTTMEDALGGCERILRTPVPLFYTHHIARFMTIWLALLPLG